MTLEDKIKEFIQYRKEIKKPIREASMSSFLKKLTKLSEGNEETAIEILEESIAQGWIGIFPLKNKNYGKTNNNNQQTSVDGLNNAAERLLQQLASNQSEGDPNQSPPTDWGYQNAS